MKKYVLKCFKMASLFCFIIAEHVDVPYDVVIFLHEYIYEKITNETINEAVELWCKNKELCLLRFGHISYWDTSCVTNMARLFYNNETFNEDISK